MNHRIVVRWVFAAIYFFCFLSGSAQDDRVQYPVLLRNAYFGLNLGYINYPFSNAQLMPGYSAQSVTVPHMAVRLTLFGYRFNENLSAQITYMRPVKWVEYQNINGDKSQHSVWMNVGGLTMKGKLPMSNKISLYGETGLGLITRNGFDINNEAVVSDASYASLLAGGGLQYHPNRKWTLNLSATWSPERRNKNQPYTLFLSGGFAYNMHPLSAERVQRNASSGAVFPRNLLQIGYTTNALGYGVNHFVAEGAVPIFWGGLAELRRGFAVNYQRNFFHTRSVFSLDLGASAGYWESRNLGNRFFTFSIYPLLRFTVLRTRPLDLYLFYSVAGPSFISRIDIDEKNTGKNFTFRDFMGMGVYAGRKRHLNAELNIGHFSNGNIFAANAGVKIPLSFTLGYAF
ncbi:MAG: acyloxyacyl hydrolase [Flavisolibacter sp.]